MEYTAEKWKYRNIIIGGVSVCILLVGSFFLFTSISHKNEAVPQSSEIKSSDGQTYSDKPLDHGYSFAYSSPYTIKTGSRPFNNNDEGFSYTAYANCTEKQLCEETESNFSVTAYENRQNWNLEEWMQKS